MNNIGNTLKRSNAHKSQEIIYTNDIQEIEKYDTNKIFHEFKRHLLKQDKKEKSKNFLMDNEYKNLLCSLRKNNVEKKEKLEKITIKYDAIKKTNNTFQEKSLFKDVKNLSLTNEDNFIASKKEEFLESKAINVDNSLCKFKPIRPMTTDNKFRINTTASKSRLFENSSQSRLMSPMTRYLSPNVKEQSNLFESHSRKSQTMIPQNHGQKSIPEISESIMMVQLEESKLQEEISSLSQSMNKLTKELSEIKKELQVQERNEKRYVHISNLATSIKNQTEYIKLQNQKGFASMMSKQDETLTHLKKFKMNLRKEKDDMETVYIDGINEFVKLQEEKNAQKNKELLFMSTSKDKSLRNSPRNKEETTDQLTEETIQKPKGLKFELISRFNDNFNQSKYAGQQSLKANVSNTKLMKKLIDELDRILELFQEKELSFESIKQQECTRVRLCKINKELLPKQRVEILEKIEQFESKYDMKIVSVENLMLRIYHELYDENERLEADCLKLTKSKEEANEELKKIMEKNSMEIVMLTKEDKLLNEKLALQKKLNSQITRNSIIFLKIIEGFYNILFKYRYMFSLALTLDVDKKLFRDTVIQIDALFSEGLMAGFGADKFTSGGNEKYDIISEHWFEELLREKGLNKELAKEFTEIMFNDHRVSLMMKKNWIESFIAKLPEKDIKVELEILDIIDMFHKECAKMYHQKLPSLSRLFLTCFKSLQMTKYESKLAASSVERGEIFLPNRPVKKLCNPEYVDQVNESVDNESEDSSLNNSKKNIDFTNESSTVQEKEMEKNPTKIIFNLETMKNRSYKKFKALNFSSSGKTYKYNESIIIPNFNMINKNEDF